MAETLLGIETYRTADRFTPLPSDRMAETLLGIETYTIADRQWCLDGDCDRMAETLLGIETPSVLAA